MRNKFLWKLLFRKRKNELIQRDFVQMCDLARIASKHEQDIKFLKAKIAQIQESNELKTEMVNRSLKIQRPSDTV